MGIGIIIFLGTLLLLVGLFITMAGLSLLKGKSNSGKVRTIAATMTTTGVAMSSFGAYIIYQVLFNLE